MVPQHVRKGLSYADAGDWRRAGFPRPLHAKPGPIHRAAIAEGAIQAAAVSRRGALGLETSKQRSLVRHCSRMDRGVDQSSARGGARGALTQETGARIFRVASLANSPVVPILHFDRALH